jgi:peptidoglycan/LPS O-acetylase OafA/YrhL
MNAKHRLGMATTCLHISTALYILGAVALFALAAFGPDDTDATASDGVLVGALAVFCLILAVVPQIAALGIRRRRFWGWVLGLIIFGLYIPSIFLPLGAFGLWGLLDAGSRAEMGVGAGARPRSAGSLGQERVQR